MATFPKTPTKNPLKQPRVNQTQPQTNDKNMNIIFSDLIYISRIEIDK